MSVVFHVNRADMPVLSEAAIEFTPIDTESLDGLSTEAAIVLGATTMTLRFITTVIKLLLERHSRISMAINGNEYRNLDRDTAHKIVSQHYDFSVSQDNKNADE